MKKKLSYRDKLVELAYIYDVKEIKDYEKSRKNLTSGQLELILKKNKIIIPKDFKSNFLRDNIIKPVTKIKSNLIEFKENKKHYAGGYRRAKKEDPSYTAYWTRGMTSIHPEQHRFLSPRECARIQSFPDQVVFQGTTIQHYTQICNAVPPLLAQALCQSIQKELLS